MIIKNPSKRKDGKSSFKELIRYIESGDKGANEKMISGCTGFAYPPKTAEDVIKEMTANASQNTRCKDPVFHAVMSWREGEIPSHEQAQEAISIYLKELNMEGCQVYYGLHSNTDNVHLHLCINRISPETSRAISPANGWTKKANTRTSRIIELQQGWQKDEGGMYEVIEGQIFEKIRENKSSGLDDKARDYENLTSAKSAQRVAKERYAGIFFEAKSWDMLHEELAKTGAMLEKKGSGCVLIVGDVPVKVSTISQKLSFKKLEARFGSYQERKADIKILPPQPEEPLRNTPDSRTYLEEKRAFYDERKKAFSALTTAYKTELFNMYERHKNERKELYSRSWKGKGATLNALRSSLAWKHVQEKKALKEWRKTKKNEILKQYDERFPSYEEWLKAHGKPRQAQKWRYRESLPMAITGTETSQEQDFFKYENVIKNPYFTEIEQWGKLSGFVYRKPDSEVAFVDVGKRIDIVNWRDEKTILDALNLAQEKWGVCVVHGSQQYKDLCVKVAAENGIKLSNPELQTKIQEEKIDKADSQIKEIQIKKEKDAEMSLIDKEFQRYHEAIGAERYRVTVFWQDKTGNRAWVLDKSANAQMISTGFTPDQLSNKFSIIEEQDKKGRNIYYTPISENVHHILIDDLTAQSLEQMKRDGYKPAVILESSSGNYQAILNVPKINKEFDKEIANKLMVEINTLYGDKNIQGAVHPHRVPRSHNNKPKHAREDGTQPEVKLLYAEKCRCDRSYGKSYELLKELQRQRNSQKYLRRIARSDSTIQPLDAYMAHAKNIFEHQRGGVSNWNRVDSMIAVRMKVTGYSTAEIKEAIEVGAKQIRMEADKDKHNWPEYAKRTAKYPETQDGQMQIQKYGNKYKDHWLRIEGREPIREKERGIEL